MKKLTISQRILLFLEENEDLHTLITRPSLWGKDYPKVSRQAFYNSVHRLKDSGYLTEIEENGEKRFRSTLKGKAKIWRFLNVDQKWDNKWRIVIFDIPETKKEMRNFFRKKLYELGYRKLQESVWINPNNIADEIEYLIELCEAKPYVHYLLVEELDNKEVLMKLFKLSG